MLSLSLCYVLFPLPRLRLRLELDESQASSRISRCFYTGVLYCLKVSDFDLASIIFLFTDELCLDTLLKLRLSWSPG